MLSLKLPAAPKLPSTPKLPSAPDFLKRATATLSSPSPPQSIKEPQTEELPTGDEPLTEAPLTETPAEESSAKELSAEESLTCERSTEELSAEEPPTDKLSAIPSLPWSPTLVKRAASLLSPLSHSPSTAKPSTEALPTKEPLTKVPRQRHVVYLVMQPVVSAVRAVSDIRQRSENTSSILEKIRLYAEGAVDFAALLGLLVAQHWAISIEDHYYHLKRMPDDTLALDLTPFAKEAVVLKLPLWKTKLSHEERGGVATCILATMMDKSKEAQSVRVEEHGAIVGHHFLYSKYRTLSYGLTLKKGHYSALFNNCQHFVFRFFNQVSTPGGVKDIAEWPSIARELWFSGMSSERKAEILGKIRRNELSVEFLLEFLLMKGATAATDGLAKDAATAAEAAARTQTVAEAAAAEVGEMIKAAEMAVKTAQAAAEMAKATAEVNAAADGQDVTEVEAAIDQAAEAEAAAKAEAATKAEAAAKSEAAAKAKAAAKAEAAAKAKEAAKVAVDAATVLAEIANAVAKKADTMAKEAAIAKAAAEAHFATAESAAWMTQALAKNGA